MEEQAAARELQQRYRKLEGRFLSKRGGPLFPLSNGQYYCTYRKFGDPEEGGSFEQHWLYQLPMLLKNK